MPPACPCIVVVLFFILPMSFQHGVQRGAMPADNDAHKNPIVADGVCRGQTICTCGQWDHNNAQNPNRCLCGSSSGMNGCCNMNCGECNELCGTQSPPPPPQVRSALGTLLPPAPPSRLVFVPHFFGVVLWRFIVSAHSLHRMFVSFLLSGKRTARRCHPGRLTSRQPSPCLPLRLFPQTNPRHRHCLCHRRPLAAAAAAVTLAQPGGHVTDPNLAIGSYSGRK